MLWFRSKAGIKFSFHFKIVKALCNLVENPMLHVFPWLLLSILFLCAIKSTLITRAIHKESLNMSIRHKKKIMSSIEISGRWIEITCRQKRTLEIRIAAYQITSFHNKAKIEKNFWLFPETNNVVNFHRPYFIRIHIALTYIHSILAGKKKSPKIQKK